MIKIYIDTGGTFTDCIATRPDGSTLRRKVLSSSAIRGNATVTDDPRTLTIHLEHDYCDHFFKGYRFLIQGNANRLYNIIASDRKKYALTLDSDIGIPTGETIQFEIQSPEEAPVFAIRMITNRTLHEKLPPLQLRLSTTKGTNALLERRG
ncbi:MAG: 5-oxoprolinase, partial [Balneolaceae bacterium]